MIPRNRDLVIYLELLLERARKGEVQMLITSVASLPLSPAGWGSLEVEGYAAFGPLVPRLDEGSLRGAFAKTLEGLAGAAAQANGEFEQLAARFAPAPEPAAAPPLCPVCRSWHDIDGCPGAAR